MNAIKLLKQQHREVKKLFAQAENATPAKVRDLAMQLADQLAVHATIEEHHFYPAAMAERTEELLREAVEEHLAAKRILADLMSDDPADPQFRAKIIVLKDLILSHVEEEEGDLFPKVERLLGDDALKALGATMQREVEELNAGVAPRDSIPAETGKPAPLPAPEKSTKKKRPNRTRELRA